VEVLAAIAAASVLALTAGLLLYYGYLALTRNRENVEMQADGTIAMDMIARAVRPASTATVTAAAGSLRVATSNRVVEFRAVAADLVYDPDTGHAGDEMTVVRGRLVSFAASNTPRGVDVRMVLKDATASPAATLEGTMTCRNPTP
jgi:hypothetical protein